MNDEKEFLTYLAALADMVPGFILKPDVVALYDEAAVKVGYKKFSIAIKKIIATRNSRDPFPALSDVLSLVSFNGMDAEELSAKIVGSVSKFGPYKSADARIYLGETAWNIIQLEGGWENVCQMLTYENMSTLQAQWRKLAVIMIQREQTKELEKIGYFSSVGQILNEAIKQVERKN